MMKYSQRVKISAARTKHGHAGSADKTRKRSPEYDIWAAMIQRCHNTAHKDFRYYGGRGIIVCKEWRDSFVKFFEHIGRRPNLGDTLERLDSNGNYEPGNVVWATRLDQARNRKSTIWVELNGVDMTLTEACRFLKIPYDRTRMRLKAGKSIEEALQASARAMP